MGYACPVCEDPQADAGHLANHLAFTALTSGGDHEEWLDEHVPEWGQYGEAELAEAVTEAADEAEYPQVFEASGDALDHEHDHDGAVGGGARDSGDLGVDVAAARDRAGGDLDEATREIVAEARELTRQRRADAEAEDGDGAEGEAGADDEAAGTGDDETDSETE